MCPHDADRMANSVDPDQTVPSGAVWSGSTLFVQTLRLITVFFMLQFHAPTVAVPTKSPPKRLQQSQLTSDKRLLTKVIKASGLKQDTSGKSVE